MQSGKNNLIPRPIQALDQFFELWFATKPLLGNIAPYQDNWQVLKGKNLSASQQQVRAKFETKGEVKG